MTDSPFFFIRRSFLCMCVDPIALVLLTRLSLDFFFFLATRIGSGRFNQQQQRIQEQGQRRRDGN